ncbi:hypothetical protein [Cochlodiniinecator piscidefendens]|uniref:hypothetical protein n=1 Tax=Cochlodiniinecator piscidefendens TaxID=2715756 RepID=UPI00140A555B|nr:hypothetical protein [Cochlodiniinecator piscidefendens]
MFKKSLSFTTLFATLAMATQALAFDPAILDDPGFQSWFDNVGNTIDSQENYQRLPINTGEQREEFLAVSSAVYTGEMSRQQFIDGVNRFYPGYAETANTLAEIMFSTR